MCLSSHLKCLPQAHVFNTFPWLLAPFRRAVAPSGGRAWLVEDGQFEAAPKSKSLQGILGP